MRLCLSFRPFVVAQLGLQGLSTAVLLALLHLSAATAALAQRPPQPPEQVYVDTTEVVVLDLMVEAVERGAQSTARRLLIGDTAPKALRKKDLEVAVGGREARIVDLERAPSALPLEESDAWEIAIYFDLVLPASVEVRWAAGILAERVEQMTELGAVEIWLADDRARRVVAPTRDAVLLDRQLSQLSLFGEAEDRLAGDRYSRDRQLGEAEVSSSLDRRQQLIAMAKDESAFVVERQDLLLDALSTLESGPRPRGARRALFLVGGNVDLAPERYYLRKLSVSEELTAELAVPELSPPGSVEGSSHGLSRSLAASGWSVFPLLPPPPEGGKVVRGLRLGKLRFAGLVVVYEEDRKPERARRFAELGEVLLEQGEYDDAADAFRRSAFHFSGDPETALEQARAVRGLAKALEQQARSGADQEARRAYEVALDLDPRLEDEIAAVHGWSVEDPERLASLFAQATGGFAVQDRGGLEEAVESLRRRGRLSVQLGARPTAGELEAVEIRRQGRSRARSVDLYRHVAWTGRGTTERMAEARARRALRSGSERIQASQRLEVFVRPAQPSVDGDGAAWSVLWQPADGQSAERAAPDARFRITWALADPAGRDWRGIVVGHALTTDGSTQHAFPRPAGLERGPGIVVVEELESGAWGVARLPG